MRNLKEETLDFLKEIGKGIEDIKFIEVARYDEDYNVVAIKSISSMDFRYDAGYGCQEIFGVVVFKDDSWAERSSYDGAEWWDYRRTPRPGEILKEL